MGFMAPALPWIGKGLSFLGGMIGAKKAQSSAQQRSPEELAALNAATTAGNQMTSTGTSLMQSGQPAAQQAMSYYSTLLGGNRGQMALATAAPRASITDTYRGAAKSLDQAGVRGAQRSQAQAELARDKAGDISRLTTGVQPGAAAALGDMGTNLISQGGTLMSNAGSLWSGLLSQGQQNRVYARGEGEKAGKSIGGFLFDILSAGMGGKKGFGTPAPFGQGYGVLR